MPPPRPSTGATLLLAATATASSAWAARLTPCTAPGFPDIRTVAPDLVTPNASAAPSSAAPGARVVQTLPGFPPGVFHGLYLPTDWKQGNVYPLIVEWGGNGPWTSPAGDYSCGTPLCNNLGYGLSAGAGYLWLQLPFVNAAGNGTQGWWWGCPDPVPPTGNCPGAFVTNTTLDYAHAAVAHVLAAYGGDPSAVLLAGFSRGALAVSYLGLGDDATAALWTAGVIAYAHFDGRPSDQYVPYPAHDPAAALGRLARLAPRPLYVIQESEGAYETQAWLNTTALPLANVTFSSTGFCNHNDAWTLRPSPARDALRAWMARAVRGARRTARAAGR
jgi:hypothetical protein